MDPAPSARSPFRLAGRVRARGRSITLLAALVTCACNPGGDAIAWQFRVADAALAAEVDALDVELRRGGCDGETLFRAEVIAGADPTSAMPPRLEDGTYGVFGSARSDDCRVLAEACEEVTLPVDGALVVSLPSMGGGMGCMPAAPGAADVALEVGMDYVLHPISAWIYGIADSASEDEMALASMRGPDSARFSSYNWETNLSNSGNYATYRNDYDAAGFSDVPAYPFVTGLEAAGPERAYVVPLSLFDRVASVGPVDDVLSQPDYLDDYFVPNLAANPAPATGAPDLDDGAVYQDDLVRYLEAYRASCAGCAQHVAYALDIQPDNWQYIYYPLEGLYPHAPGDPGDLSNPGGYLRSSDWLPRAMALACAVNAVDPDAIVLGPSMTHLIGQYTPLGAIEFIEAFAETAFDHAACGNAPLIDAFTMSWPPQEGLDVDGYLDLARTLYDPTYRSPSWLDDYFGAPVDLIARLRRILDENGLGSSGIGFVRYGVDPALPGEPNDQITAIVIAEMLGAFGSEGVRYALHAGSDTPRPGVQAAFSMYRDYDGIGGRFGDVSMPAVSSDLDRVAVFASTFADRPEEVVLVVINRSDAELDASLAIRHRRRLTTAERFVLTSDQSLPVRASALEVTNRNALVVTLPARSVTTLALR